MWAVENERMGKIRDRESRRHRCRINESDAGDRINVACPSKAFYQLDMNKKTNVLNNVQKLSVSQEIVPTDNDDLAVETN